MAEILMRAPSKQKFFGSYQPNLTDFGAQLMSALAKDSRCRNRVAIKKFLKEKGY